MSGRLSLRTTHIIIKYREMRKLRPTFRFIASKGHWLCWVEWVKGSTPVTTVTSSNTTPSALHARWATVKGVTTGHAVIMEAIYKIIASSIPTICREKMGSFSLSIKFYLNFPQKWGKKKNVKKPLSNKSLQAKMLLFKYIHLLYTAILVSMQRTRSDLHAAEHSAALHYAAGHHLTADSFAVLHFNVLGTW